MVTSGDIEDIISKLSSDKAKAREDGVKLLNSWLEGERSIAFCKHLTLKTLELKPNEIPNPETWPFLLKLLIECISSEIYASKKRPPKLLFAKTLRIFVQHAENAKFSGKMLHLLSVVKSLFNHIWDVIRDVPTFQSEYGVILRCLLAVKDYCFQMRKRVYSGLVLLYMSKVKSSLSVKNKVESQPKEEVFRCIMTLHSLLENPPGDFPDNLRDDISKGFTAIFSHIRDEGKISRKLIECINAFLLKDGPNLEFRAMEIHSSLQEFMFRCWLSTHDCGLKDALVLYARLQLRLTRSAADGGYLIKQLLDVVCKDLDQNSTTGANVLWGETAKDDKLGTLTSSQCGLMELAASVFYRACFTTTKESPPLEKRCKTENAAACLRDGLTKGKWPWNGAFCFLLRNYQSHICKGFIAYWFEGICESFERILNDANTQHTYDALLWVLRSLQELSSVRLLPILRMKTSQLSSTTAKELGGGWHTIWSLLVHGLPIFSNVTSVADASLMLLGNIISNDLITMPIIPQDIWDLRLFKHMPSMSALYFIVCYFTRKGSQGDLRDILLLRQNLLRAIFGLLNWKEPNMLNERMSTLLPGAVFSLCAGLAPIPHCFKVLSSSNMYIDTSEAVEDRIKMEEHDRDFLCELSECSIEILAGIESVSSVEESHSQYHQSVRLPRQIRQPLLVEMENCFFMTLINEEIEKIPLSDLLFLSALICNFIYGSILTRLREENSPFITKMCFYLVELLQCAVSIVEKNLNDLKSRGSLGPNPILDNTGSLLVSVRSFVCSPFFSICGDENNIDDIPSGDIVQVLERLLRALVKLLEEGYDAVRDVQSEMLMPEDFSSSATCPQNSYPLDGSKSRIVDIDLDVAEDAKDIDVLSINRKDVSGIQLSSTKWKIDIISVIGSFFPVIPDVTWEVMLNLMRKENGSMLCKNILHYLCKHFSLASSANLLVLANLMRRLTEVRLSLKHCCVDILTGIHSLLQALIRMSTHGKVKSADLSVQRRPSEQSLESLAVLVKNFSEVDLLDWVERVLLIDCICDFVVLDPCIGQEMVERLLAMVQDADFRVRLFLARHIGVLFQTWDGHYELFQDIYSNIGVKLVMHSREKIVTAPEVLACVMPPRPIMETVIVTLGHLAFHSEKIEVEAIFMICVVAAIDPSQRELAYTILDNLSRQLGYTTRSKYLEEVLGLILFSWVACSVSLAALIEIRDLFLPKSEPKYFVQYCCPWLLPALILGGSTTNLKWIATIAGETLPVLVKCNFVPIFAICMAFHCSEKPGKENGALVLRGSILHIAEMSELERDNLIKRHMVSIVSFILSLTTSSLDPALPFFSKDVIVLAIQTVVDGFLEMDVPSENVGIVDKINIFRADRVFKFMVEMHYKIAAAVHHRHMCQRLCGVEVLIDIIGHRAAVSSTSNYVFNLVGQFIGCQALLNQCCRILSKLLRALKLSPCKDSISALGEQLQFMVSKLVAFYVHSESSGEICSTSSDQVVSLLHELVVDSDPSFYEYIRELEPFPEIDCFNGIRTFHQELCKAYSPRDHFLKFIKTTSHLPQRFLMRSLQTLHNKLIHGQIIPPEKNVEGMTGQLTCWPCEPDIVFSIWKLISMCGSSDVNNVRVLVADFISRVGIGDPHRAVFQLPGDYSKTNLLVPINDGGITKVNFNTDTGMPEELLVAVIRLLKKFLLDDSVKIIDMASRVLQGIFSTEKGQQALLSFEPYEKSLIAVHSKGVNVEHTEKLLSHSERSTIEEVTSIKDSSLWSTHGKTYEMWICHLIYSLIDYCNDTILRLCQDIVLLEPELAELLFSYVFANLSRRKEPNLELCKLISSQVEENIFTESNELIKSTQVMLNALNELRLRYVMEHASTSSVFSKHDRPSIYSSRSHSTSEKSKNAVAASSAMVISTSSWEKVFWLSINYLLVAKSAIHCGSYFTSFMYVEHWCKEQFNSLTMGSPDFSPFEELPSHIEILISAVTQINEPDSLYGIIQSHKLTSQIITCEHEGNWSNALEYYDLQVRSAPRLQMDGFPSNFSLEQSQKTRRKSYKGLIRSLQQTGCTHILDLYCQGLTSQEGELQHDSELIELQYEAAWRAGNWDFSLLNVEFDSPTSTGYQRNSHFNENLHSCLRGLQEGDSNEFHMRLTDSKQELVLSIHHASKESTEYIYSSIIKLQILDHLGMAWDLRWKPTPYEEANCLQEKQKLFHKPHIPTMDKLEWLNMEWGFILRQTQLHMNLLEPFIAFRRVLLQILSCKDCTIQHLLQSASMLRKGSRFSLAAAALHEFKFLSADEGQHSTSYIGCLGRLEEAKLLRAQGQHEMAINLARYILHQYQLNEEAFNVYRLVGKWLAETRSSNSRVILDQYLKHAVELTKLNKGTNKQCIVRQCQTHFHLAHYADALFRSYEERLTSNEWQAAMRLRKHKKKELEALIRQLKCSRKGEKTDCSARIQELQKQLSMDTEEAEKLQDDKNNFLTLALEGYQRCLVIGDKYDVRSVFRLVSLWFSLSSRQNIIKSMLSVVNEVQSYKFIPLVYQIASRLGISKDGQGPCNFQSALVSLVKKMAIDHPYHTIFQLLALANGDRVKDKQRSRSSFVVDMDKKQAAEDLLLKLSAHHCSVIMQMKQMVEVYIKLAELETKREDTNKKIQLPTDIRSLRQLELVPVVTATIPLDHSCQYHEGSFPYFKGLADSIMVMNGINAPKVVECLGSDGQKYRQLAKSGNDDLRQDAVMEQFFGLVNTFLQNNRDTWKRRLGIRTYKVVPFTPSAGVVEWVDGTIPLGEYLLGSSRNGGAHGRYGVGDWSFVQCREHMTNEKDKRKAFQNVSENFRPVMHYFFLERFLQPADWFEKRLSYTRSVAASSMVGFIVGLGDRHSMNILMDQTTAEVVHIDLGVAFEQGLMLKTPERVPFRLTRDIVDGMGVTGVEGVFRRCCEKTLCVMRSNKEALLTIIEVFIYDPLYKWALSPLKALQLQKEIDDDTVPSLEDSQDIYEGNKDAARALMRVKQKLDGYEESEMRSVRGQVQQLIQDAIDPERLCQMYPGWGAWL